ncbi:MAG: AbrB family transcriptional regulator [Actinobacteria bacterium RBG_19FT_COMBO_54_7]|uniref:AbrB family transcriptional regulator n=1 Tax=Candidatus Solincola sediminis TaxID=1797199 RepID=A0A1F2WLH8_9ACTN|nr:MAG: AbrB family transcriptional regulator [Candidatus Solincola sediminis]OFW58595.1 MAG: AbrB family transcriptional regulator [Candidatus Solincola sediminis]OFW65136.1 MAG: AbrB family transcriptional regulator [Actinobacteria bacterium RBG_19FT_COMBO_54_7]
MKATGIVRKIDELGRIVIPMELRRTLDISERDPIEIFTDGDKIVLTKYEPGCSFCNSGEKLRTYKGSRICQKCINDLKRK